MNYREKLLSTEWREKREKILERDSFTCQECFNKDVANNSKKGIVTNLVCEDNYFTALGNKSDPRFRFEKPKYKITFKTSSNKKKICKYLIKRLE